MRIAPEGLPQIVLATFLLGGLSWLAVGLGYWPAAVPLVGVWLWVLSFFRDPRRASAAEPGQLTAPADGTVMDIDRLEQHDLIGGPAVRVGIFMSLFNVHVNRFPCGGTVRSVRHLPGKFRDARSPDAGKVNESNTLVIDPDPPHRGPVVVRQIAGLVARRIVCHAMPGMHLAAGDRFGMIKFGSRGELIVPDDGKVDINVSVGQKVYGGLTVLMTQRTEATSEEDENARDREIQPAEPQARA